MLHHYTTAIVIDQHDKLQRQLAEKTRLLLLDRKNVHARVCTLADLQVEELGKSWYVILLELKTPFLSKIVEEDWLVLKKIATSAQGVVWVTQGSGKKSHKPDLDLATGLARNLRSEIWDLNFIHLSIEDTRPEVDWARLIVSVYDVNVGRASEECESEYRDDRGRLEVGRVTRAEAFNKYIHVKTKNSQPEIYSFGAVPSRDLKLNIATPGLLDTFHFIDDDLSDKALKPDEVELVPHSISLNFKDVLVALGNMSGTSLGIDCAGTISRAGAASGFNAGDRVCCCTTTGTFKTRVRAHSSAMAKIEDSMSFEAASTLPSALCTAYYALIHLAHLEEGESVLIHSGAGGVGQAAIQIASLRKAKIFTTVGTKEKKDWLIKNFGIPESHILSSRNPSFAQAVMRLTGGAGVDVILNSLSGEAMRVSWECIAPLGRFIEIGKAELKSNRALPMNPFLRNVTFASVDLTVLMGKAKTLMKRILQEVMALIKSGSLFNAQPLRIFDLSGIEEAFRYMQSGKSIGKIVVRMNTNVPVPVSYILRAIRSNFLNILIVSNDRSCRVASRRTSLMRRLLM